MRLGRLSSSLTKHNNACDADIEKTKNKNKYRGGMEGGGERERERIFLEYLRIMDNFIHTLRNLR